MWAVALGLLLALPIGGRQRVSVELWFTALSLWLLIGLAMALLRAAPPHGGRSGELVPTLTRPLRRWLKRLRHAPEPDNGRLKDHRYIEALVVRATSNERSHARRLRPRLQNLVDYHLSLRHGIDRATDPHQAGIVQQQLLGDTAWLVDPTVTDRVPTVRELDRFLRRLDQVNNMSGPDQQETR